MNVLPVTTLDIPKTQQLQSHVHFYASHLMHYLQARWLQVLGFFFGLKKKEKKKAFITNSVEVHKKTNLNRTEVIFKFLKCR